MNYATILLRSGELIFAQSVPFSHLLPHIANHSHEFIHVSCYTKSCDACGACYMSCDVCYMSCDVYYMSCDVYCVSCDVYCVSCGDRVIPQGECCIVVLSQCIWSEEHLWSYSRSR